jgi:hypothetical protein
LNLIVTAACGPHPTRLTLEVNMQRFAGTKWGMPIVVGLFAGLLSVQPGTAADSKAPGGSPLTARVDQLLAQKLRAEKVPASPRADDAEFLRRVTLDLTGVIPTADKAAAFLASKDPNKRARLIDELLASPRFGRHLADLWQDLLLARSSDNRRLQTAAFGKWLENNFNANKPWDAFVRELLTASGNQDAQPAVTYFLSNSSVDKITDNVTRTFLGVQLQCAQCHNHPFTGWKQTEYWGMAAFFMKVQVGNVRKAAKNGGSAGVTETARPAKRNKKNALPPSAKIVPAKFLQGSEPALRPAQPYRPVLAGWITSLQNPFFARAMVNRVWAQLFGRGLVNPVDDMHEGNTPSHPQLLKELTAALVASGFDLKALYRTLCNSQAYQRTSRPVEGEDAEAALYSRMAIKVLSPEQLFDSLTQVAGSSGNSKARGAKGAKKVQAKGKKQGGPRAAFVAAFRLDEGADPTEYQAGIPQALRLMNSQQFNTSALVNGLVQSGKSPEQAIERLYLTALARHPRPAEKSKLLAHVEKVGPRQAYGDIAWALLNSSEFSLNH